MKPLSKQTHYEILEVAPTAPTEVIDSAWHKLRRILGPGSIATYSLVDPAEQQALLLRLDEARTVLIDPVARRAYDRSLGLAPPEVTGVPQVDSLQAVSPDAWQPDRAQAAPVDPRQAAQPESVPQPSSFEEALGRISRAAAGHPPAGHRIDEAFEVEADTASVGIETIEEVSEGDEFDVLELEDGDVLEIFDATPGPMFLESPVHSFRSAPSVEEETVTAPLVGESRSTSLATLSESSRPASGTSVADVELDPAPGVEAESTEPEPASTPEVTFDTEFTGSLLRDLREASGLSLEEFAGRTRINLQHLVHVEAEAWSSLPERVFLRGILGNYARELRLDATRVCNTYLARRPS